MAFDAPRKTLGRRGAAVFSRNRRRRASRRPPVCTTGPGWHGPGFKPVRTAWTGFETDRRLDSPSCDVHASFQVTDSGRGTGGLAQSGKEVRAALSAWLLLSRRGDAHAPVSETAVIFSAYGRPARTHVPMRSGGGIVVHEQLWRREAKGWSLLDDREAWTTQ